MCFDVVWLSLYRYIFYQHLLLHNFRKDVALVMVEEEGENLFVQKMDLDG
jgi:hypothetical protein